MEEEREKQRFFGLHFDYQPDPTLKQACPIGARTTPQSIDAIIDAINPDYLQCDCKSHPGWSSYPTKVGLPYPDIVGDPLQVWRDVTTRRGIGLYAHYSGVIDAQQCKRHPDWGCQTTDGLRDPRWYILPTSTFGPYVDKLLIPQLQELADHYHVDGVWLDGECWGTKLDYSPSVLELFKEKTGIDIRFHPPIKPEDPYYHEFRDFCREQFRIYLRHYVDTLHQMHPNFKICSNWAFSSHMPEPVSAAVDFLSGDYSPTNSFNRARFEGRCLAGQKMPWDLMCWGFSRQGGDAFDVMTEHFPKGSEQIKQEAAAVISLGGGFQCFLKQRWDGSVRQNLVEAWADVAEFCRERKRWCYQAAFVPQVALLYSTFDHYRVSEKLLSTDKIDSVYGMTQLLCETQHSWEVCNEHHLRGHMDKWPLIVVPDIHYLEDDFRSELLEYVQKGGSLLLTGPHTMAVFSRQLGLNIKSADVLQYVSLDGREWASMSGSAATITVQGKSRAIGWRSSEQDGDGDRIPAALIIESGKGRIAFLPLDAGASYISRKANAIRALMLAVTKELYEPFIHISGSMYVDVAILEKNDMILIQLVNTAGSHDNSNWRSINEITPIGPLEISIRLPKPPQSILLQPCDKPVDGHWESGFYRFTVDRLKIHDIVAIQP